MRKTLERQRAWWNIQVRRNNFGSYWYKPGLHRCKFAPDLLILSLLMLLLATAIPAQTPTQTPTSTPPDKRDIGLQPNAAANSPTDQTKSKEARPELVLQTAYNNFFGATRLGFSRDER